MTAQRASIVAFAIGSAVGLLMLFGLGPGIALGAASTLPDDAMLAKAESIYEFVLQIKLSKQQRVRFQEGVRDYWRQNDQPKMDAVRDTLSTYGDQEKLRSLQEDSQQAIVQALKAYPRDPASAVLVEAYELAHPERSARAMPVFFADLVGTWREDDAVLANKGYDGRATGISYTDARTFKVDASGRFGLIHSHEHCSGSSGCCQLDGTDATGQLSIRGDELVLDVRGGTSVSSDSCNSATNSRRKLSPAVQKLNFTLRREQGENAARLCWTQVDGDAVCLVRQLGAKAAQRP